MKNKKRLGYGILPMIAAFCVISALVSISLQRITESFYTGSNTMAVKNGALQHLADQCAYLRLKSAADIKNTKEQISGTDYTFSLVRTGSTQVEKGCSLDTFTASVFYKNETQARATEQLVLVDGAQSPPKAVETACPIGTITIWPLSMSDLPKNGKDVWLPCDGRAYDVNEYPELALVLSDMFAKNYYLGHVLPNYTDVFLRGSAGAAVNTFLGNGATATEGRFWEYIPSIVTYNGDEQFLSGYTDFFSAPEVFPPKYYLYPDEFSPTGFKVWRNVPIETRYDAIKKRDENYIYAWKIGFDTSKVIRTGKECRPVNKSVNYIIKAK